MKKVHLIAVFSLILLSCSSEQEKDLYCHESTVIGNRMLLAEFNSYDIKNRLKKSVAFSKVEESLLNTEAVEFVQFESDKEVNQVEIAFDKTKISVRELIAILNEDQIYLAELETKPYSSKIEISEELNQCHESDESGLTVSEGSIQTPNLLELLSGLVR